MRIISAQANNFASYKTLNFNFINQGLTLISGPTGSGKSTLCDLIPWVLFSCTAKGGAVSEVLSWGSDQPTKGTVHLELNNTAYIIKRTRGHKPKDNDLTFMEVGGPIQRGKDLPDTQRLINSILGMDAELYLAGAYYHEFSQTAQFFTTTAKIRRTICEQLVDLSLAKTLSAKLGDEAKNLSKQLINVERDIDKTECILVTLDEGQTKEIKRAKDWKTAHKTKLAELQLKVDNFEVEKQASLNNYLQLEANYFDSIKNGPKTRICDECGSEVTNGHIPTSPFEHKIEQVKTRENSALSELAFRKQEKNPYNERKLDLSVQINNELLKLEQLDAAKKDIHLNQVDNNLLQEIVTTYRSVSIINAIQQLESKTNQLLTDHFDAEILVTFEVADADKLDVTIHKDGNTATYTQLSKGQRCILKLSFAVAVMNAVANHSGVNFPQIFLDEFTDGCDDNTKAKAVRLLEELALEKESIFTIEHSTAVKALFSNSYEVQLINGESVIEKM